MRALTRNQVTKQGLEVISSAGRVLEVEQASAPNGVKRKAMAFETPSGARFVTDQGFGFNPGKAAYQPELDNYAALVARQYVKGVLTAPDVRPRYPVAVPAADMTLLNSSSQTG